jgi:hypothetical protein
VRDGPALPFAALDRITALGHDFEDRPARPGTRQRAARRHGKPQMRRVGQPIDGVTGEAIAVGGAEPGAGQQGDARSASPRIQVVDRAQMADLAGDVDIGRAGRQARVDDWRARGGERAGGVQDEAQGLQAA